MPLFYFSQFRDCSKEKLLDLSNMPVRHLAMLWPSMATTNVIVGAKLYATTFMANDKTIIAAQCQCCLEIFIKTITAVTVDSVLHTLGQHALVFNRGR